MAFDPPGWTAARRGNLSDAPAAAPDAADSLANPLPDPLPAIDYDNLDYSLFVTETEEPVDSFFAERLMHLLVDSLYASWTGPRNGPWAGWPFLAATNVGVFDEPSRAAIVPDAFLALGIGYTWDVHEKRGRSYFVWLRGKPPDVVVEIVSPTDGGEYGPKMARYAAMGVPYYVVHDPSMPETDDELRAFRLKDGAYVPQDPAWLDDVELGLGIWQGAYLGLEDRFLRWRRRDGGFLPFASEVTARVAEEGRQETQLERLAREQAQARADREAERARQEAERADQEAERARQEKARAEMEAERARREAERAAAAETALDAAKAALDATEERQRAMEAELAELRRRLG